MPLSEQKDEVSMDLELGNNMYQLHRKVNPNETVVGWYSTGREVTAQSMLIHTDYYAKFTPNAVLVLIDTSLGSGTMDIKAYVSRNVGIPKSEMVSNSYHFILFSLCVLLIIEDFKRMK